MDQNFINQVKPILELLGICFVLGIWFDFHWALYALKTVLLSAFIVENIIDILKFDLQSVDDLLPNQLAHVSYKVVVPLLSHSAAGNLARMG